MEFLKEGSSFK